MKVGVEHGYGEETTHSGFCTRSLLGALIHRPVRRNPRTTPEIIRAELEQGFAERSPDDLQCALVLAFCFGLSRKYALLLCKLIEEDWHHSHEDLADALQDLRVPCTIDCLYRTTLRKHDYLAYNDSESLAVKWIWALHDIGTFEAIEKLKLLSQCDLSGRVRETALERLLELAGCRRAR
jgi:hypothetical protein